MRAGWRRWSCVENKGLHCAVCAFVCISMSHEGIYASVCVIVCPSINVFVAPWVCVYAFMTLAVCVLCVSCENVSKIQAATDLVANQPIKKKIHKPLSRLQCEPGQMNLTHSTHTHRHTHTHSLYPAWVSIRFWEETTISKDLDMDRVCVLVFVVLNLAYICVFCWRYMCEVCVRTLYFSDSEARNTIPNT